MLVVGEPDILDILQWWCRRTRVLPGGEYCTGALLEAKPFDASGTLLDVLSGKLFVGPTAKINEFNIN